MKAPLLFLAMALPLSAGSAGPPDYSAGVGGFPRFWRAYQQQRVRPPDMANRRIEQMVRAGKLELSIANLVELVEENSLDVAYAAYNVEIAETDILRAKSGQAARGVPGIPLPGEVFASAVGAGIGGASNLSSGGTGPAAISGSSRQVVIGPRGAFDPDIQVNFSFDRTSSPLNTLQVAGVNTVVTPSTVVQTRFEKSFATGTSFSLTLNSQRQSSTQQFLLYDPAYTGRLSISAYQPLLNGFGFAINRRFIDIARNDLAISHEMFRQQLTSALVNAQNAYWDLAAAGEIVHAAEQSVAAARDIVAQNRKEFDEGLVARLDIVQAQSELAANRRDLIVAQANRQIKELQLKNLISRNPAGLQYAEIVVTDALPDPRESDMPTLAEALETALRNRSELLQARMNIKNQEVVEKFTRNSLKPTFSVFGTYASSALVGGIGPLFQQIGRQVPYPEYAAGFSLTIPLRNRSAEADHARAQLEMRQSETAYARTQSQVGLDVRGGIIALMQAKAQVEAARLALESSQAALQAERTKMQLGLSTSYRVIQFERDYVNAESQQVQAQVTYAKARVQLDRVMGMTLRRNNISVDDVLQRVR